MDRRDRGEERGLPLADEVAGVDGELADDAGHRGLDHGVLEVQLGLSHRGLGRLDGRFGELDGRALAEDRVLERGFGTLDPGGRDLLLGDRRVQILLGNRHRLGERTIAGHVLSGLAEVGLGLIELGAGPIHHRDVPRPSQIRLRLGELRARRLQRRLVLVLLDHEQHLAPLDLGALPEPHLLEHARDPGPDLDGGDALGSSHELGGDGGGLLRDLGHDDRGGRGGRGRLLGLRDLAALASGDEAEQHEGGQVTPPGRRASTGSSASQHRSGLRSPQDC
jgi:hypothetical protein